MHKAAIGVVVGALLVPIAASGASSAGSYLTPFREDHAVFANGVFQGGTYQGQPTNDKGCVASAANGPAGNPQAYRCMPAGASMVMLPDGRILYWDALEGTENIGFLSTNTAVTDGGRLTVNDESRVLTLGPTPTWTKPSPVDGGAHNTSHAEDLPLPPPLAATHYPYNDGSLFCSDQVLLPNGMVLDAGGTDYYSEPTIPGTDKGIIELQGVRNTRLFDPTSDQWKTGPTMNYGRWYPSLVTLASGDVFVASGVTKLIKPIYPTHLADSGRNVTQTETLANGVWTYNGASADRSLPLFPRLHLLPDGHVFYDAAGQAFNPAGEAYDEALWGVAASYDPTTKAWSDLGIPGLDSGALPIYAGFRGSTFSAALEMRPDTNGAYNSASYLTAGGVLLPTPGSVVSVADSRIDTVAGAGADESLTTTRTAPLLKSRWYGTGVPLPDGTVYAVSGADIDEVVLPGLESPITEAERFIPTLDSKGNYTGGTWVTAGDQARKRTYHNNAILLPDGSVLIGGHAPIPFLYGQTHDGIDLPGRPGTNNSHDASFQVYRPPYFDKTRPQVEDVTVNDRTLTIHTDVPASTISSVVLERNTAQTHLVDADARTVSLPVLSRTGNQIRLAIPGNSSVLPNGPYLLFVNQNTAHPGVDVPGENVPSIGQQMTVTGNPPSLSLG